MFAQWQNCLTHFSEGILIVKRCVIVNDLAIQLQKFVLILFILKSLFYGAFSSLPLQPGITWKDDFIIPQKCLLIYFILFLCNASLKSVLPRLSLVYTKLAICFVAAILKILMFKSKHLQKFCRFVVNSSLILISNIIMTNFFTCCFCHLFAHKHFGSLIFSKLLIKAKIFPSIKIHIENFVYFKRVHRFLKPIQTLYVSNDIMQNCE